MAETSPIPVVPTLGSDPYLTDPVEIIASVLRHYMSAPKTVTVTWITESISLRETLSRWGNEVTEVAVDKVREDLTDAFNRIFGAQVSVEVKSVDQPTGYDLVISVGVIVNGEPYSLNRNVTVSADGHIDYQQNTLPDDEE